MHQFQKTAARPAKGLRHSQPPEACASQRFLGHTREQALLQLWRVVQRCTQCCRLLGQRFIEPSRGTEVIDLAICLVHHADNRVARCFGSVCRRLGKSILTHTAASPHARSNPPWTVCATTLARNWLQAAGLSVFSWQYFLPVRVLGTRRQSHQRWIAGLIGAIDRWTHADDCHPRWALQPGCSIGYPAKVFGNGAALELQR